MVGPVGGVGADVEVAGDDGFERAGKDKTAAVERAAVEVANEKAGALVADRLEGAPPLAHGAGRHGEVAAFLGRRVGRDQR